MIRVILPAHLRTLARINGEVKLDIEGPVTQCSVLDALEARYPMLRGTIRDQATQQRRPFVRFFACEEDLSHEPPDAPLPGAVASGVEPFLVVGAIAGGSLPVSNKKVWAGRIVSALPVVFLLVDAVAKIMKVRAAVEGTAQLGYPASVVLPIGVVLLLCTLLYAIPRTSVLGAILIPCAMSGCASSCFWNLIAKRSGT